MQLQQGTSPSLLDRIRIGPEVEAPRPSTLLGGRGARVGRWNHGPERDDVTLTHQVAERGGTRTFQPRGHSQPRVRMAVHLPGQRQQLRARS